MRYDVVQLREFYASGLGKAVRHALTMAVRERWPSLGGDTLVGVGYANPLLRSFLRKEKQEQKDSAMVMPLMPAEQGAVVWPDYGANRSVLYPPGQFPLRDQQANRLLLLHTLEHSRDADALMSECWRVLVPGGRLIAIVPRRRSFWSRLRRSPFAQGQAYTPGQLRALVCEKFTHIHTRGVLFFPPSQSSGLLKVSRLLERICPPLAPLLGGVLLIEVEKQLYAGVKRHKNERSLRGYVGIAPPAKPAMPRQKPN